MCCTVMKKMLHNSRIVCIKRIKSKRLIIKKILNYLIRGVHRQRFRPLRKIFKNKVVKCHGTPVLNVLNLSSHSMARMTKP